MLRALWSSKGGVGVSVSVALLARCAADLEQRPVMIVDFAGDQAAIFGVDASGDAPVEIAPNLELLTVIDGRPPVTLGELASTSRLVIADCGRVDSQAAREVIAVAHRVTLVVRPCYLSLRRASQHPLRRDDVLLITEPDRALRRREVEAVLGVSVAELPYDAGVARCVDAGLAGRRVPRPAQRALRALLEV